MNDFPAVVEAGAKNETRQRLCLPLPETDETRLLLQKKAPCTIKNEFCREAKSRTGGTAVKSFKTRSPPPNVLRDTNLLLLSELNDNLQL